MGLVEKIRSTEKLRDEINRSHPDSRFVKTRSEIEAAIAQGYNGNFVLRVDLDLNTDAGALSSALEDLKSLRDAGRL